MKNFIHGPHGIDKPRSVKYPRLKIELRGKIAAIDETSIDYPKSGDFDQRQRGVAAYS